MASLTLKGLSEEEAFLVAVKRMGNVRRLPGISKSQHTRSLEKTFLGTHGHRGPQKQNAGLDPYCLLAISAGLLTELTRLFG